jgi:WD40 repeat protein
MINPWRLTMLRILVSLFFVATMLVLHDGAVVGQSVQPKTPGVDAFGDPLPEGAVARIGTTRFRHGGKDLIGFSQDGKRLLYLGTGAIHAFDVVSGREAKSTRLAADNVRGFRRNRRFGGQESPLAVSADGKVVAVAQPGSGITVIDVEGGQERKQFASNSLFKNAQPYQVAAYLSSDGKYLLAGSDGRGERLPVAWFDTTTGERVQEIAAANNGFFLASQLSPDDKEVAALEVGNDNKMKLRFFDIGTGAEKRSVEVPGNNNNTFRFALRPDGKTMVVRDGTGGVLHLYDYTGDKELKEIRTFTDANNGFFLLTRDGKEMFVTGTGVVHHWDVETGKEIRQLVAPNLSMDNNQFFGPGGMPSSSSLALSRDGKTLAASGSQSFAVFETQSGKQLAGSSSGVSISVVLFTPDSKSLIVSNSENQVQQWAVPATKLERTLDKADIAAQPMNRGFDLFSGFMGKAQFSEDGKLLAVSLGAGGVGVWEAGTGKFRKVFGTDDNKQQNFGPDSVPVSFAFAPRGNMLAVGLQSGAVKLFDAASGEALRSWTWHSGSGRGGRADAGVMSLAFSPDGKTLAGGTMAGMSDGFPQIEVVLWEVATGNPRLRINGGVEGADKNQLVLIFSFIDEMALSLNFAPDGKTLAIGTFTGVHIADVFTGKEQMTYSGRMMFGKTATFSRDGKLLFLGKMDGTLRVLDAATGRTLRDFPGHSEAIYSLALSPDGTMLASGSDDSTVLLWPIAELRKPATAVAVRPAAKDLDGAWQELANADAGRAYKAMGLLAAAPAEATQLLKQHLKPIAPADPKLVEKLLDELNSDKFAVRDKANLELEKLGDLAALALRERLNAKPSLEMRQRMDKLVAKLNGPVQAPEMMQILRGIETLERIGTRPALEALTALAGGAPGHRVTEDARAAMQRLQKNLESQ